MPRSTKTSIIRLAFLMSIIRTAPQTQPSLVANLKTCSTACTIYFPSLKLNSISQRNCLSATLCTLQAGLQRVDLLRRTYFSSWVYVAPLDNLLFKSSESFSMPRIRVGSWSTAASFPPELGAFIVLSLVVASISFSWCTASYSSKKGIISDKRENILQNSQFVSLRQLIGLSEMFFTILYPFPYRSFFLRFL